MDERLEKDNPLTREETTPTRRFAALSEESGATYPLLTPAAAAHVGQEEEIFDEQILAGLVNI